MKLNAKQSSELIRLIHDADAVNFFLKVKSFGVKNSQLSQFEQEYISSSNGVNWNYFDRLLIFVNSLCNADDVELNKTKLDSFTLNRLETLRAHLERVTVYKQECEEQRDLALSPIEKQRLNLEIRKSDESIQKYRDEYYDLIR